MFQSTIDRFNEGNYELIFLKPYVESAMDFRSTEMDWDKLTKYFTEADYDNLDWENFRKLQIQRSKINQKISSYWDMICHIQQKK